HRNDAAGSDEQSDITDVLAHPVVEYLRFLPRVVDTLNECLSKLANFRRYGGLVRGAYVVRFSEGAVVGEGRNDEPIAIIRICDGAGFEAFCLSFRNIVPFVDSASVRFLRRRFGEPAIVRVELGLRRHVVDQAELLKSWSDRAEVLELAWK